MKSVFVTVTFLAIAALTACGSSEQPAGAAASSSAESAATPAAAAETAESPVEVPAQAAAPTESAVAQLSEVDDDLESSGETATTNVASALPIRMASAATTPPSSRFKEGTNYKTLVPAQPTDVGPGEVEVVEVFWYGCGHCYALDPLIEDWRHNGKPDYVKFHRLPAMWNDTLRMHARLFYTAEALGKLDELHTPIFREIHVNGNPLNTETAIKAFFAAHGVSDKDFDDAFGSFAVESKLQRADFLNRRYHVTGVPLIVVNGKYTTDVSSAGGQKELFDVIDDLAAHEHGAT
jgi:protein dithiol oxidoreductase (disulfide-forming)